MNEIPVYDINVFSTVILYIGGNDAANGKDQQFLEEKNQQLISLIKCKRNSACRIIFCTVTPRGDTDVTPVNRCITKLADYWRDQNVRLASECYDVFFKDSQQSKRFFNADGIHLSTSGINHLLDAISRQFNIIQDFAACVFDKGPMHS